MRSYCIILVTFFFLLACVCSASKTTVAERKVLNVSPERHSYAENHSDVSTKRQLSTTDDEERGTLETSKIWSSMSKLWDFMRLRMWSFMKTESVFKRFQVGQIEDSLSDSQRVEIALATIRRPKMKLLMQLFSLKKKSLIEAFTKHYGDDIMAEALATARKSGNERTKNIAKELSTELIHHWKKSGESNLGVFKLLKIHDGTLNPRNIVSRKLEMLYDFIKLENGESSSKVLIETLINGFQGEDKFVLLIAEAKTNPSFSQSQVRIAEMLETEHLKTLLSMENFAVNDLFTRLKLKEEGVKALISPKLDFLTGFIKHYNLQNPARRTDLFKAFKDGFGGYGKFAVLIAEAQTYPKTSLQVVGAKYEGFLFRRMWMKRMDPEKFKKKLRKVDSSETELANAIWKRYMAFWVECQMKLPRPQP